MWRARTRQGAVDPSTEPDFEARKNTTIAEPECDTLCALSTTGNFKEKMKMDKDRSVNHASDQSAQKGKPSIEDILKLRDAIMEEARRKIDPEGKGIDGQMSFAGGWGDRWEWGEMRFLMAYVAVFVRVELAIVAGAGTIGAGIMFGSEAGSHYAGLTLGVSAALALWVAISAAASQLSRR
jgi:hypothetical protein